MADSAAKEACGLDGDGGPIDYQSCKSMVKAAVVDPPIAHERSAAVYAGHSRQRDKLQVKTRRDQVELARLRSGHHMALAAYRHRINESKPALCPNCEEEDQDLVHWWRCPAMLARRIQWFGEEDGGLEAEMGTSHESPNHKSSH